MNEEIKPSESSKSCDPVEDLLKLRAELVRKIARSEAANANNYDRFVIFLYASNMILCTFFILTDRPLMAILIALFAIFSLLVFIATQLRVISRK